MNRGQITIKDLARKLNLSTSTVSRALRDLPDVSEKTKKKVRLLAKELDYEPNSIALSLVTKRTNTVGIMIPGFIIHFYSSAISAIQKHLMESGFNVIICQSGEDYKTEVNNVHALLSSRVDGIICSISRDTKDTDHLKQIQRKGIPLIMFNRVCHELNVSKVLVNDYGGARDAVEHLVTQGCKRIAHIAGPAGLQITNNRLKGYTDILKLHNMEIDQDLIVECDFTMESGMEGMKHLLSLSSPPDAVFAVCDAAAFGAMRVIKEAGIRIPEDIAIVGFTNEPLAELVDPPLTTVAQPTYDIGRTAARLFLEQIRLEPEDRFPETRILKTELMVRDSSRKTIMKSGAMKGVTS